MRNVRNTAIGLAATLSLIGAESGTVSASAAQSARTSQPQAHAQVTTQKLKQEIVDKEQELKIFRSVLTGREQLLAQVDSDYDAHARAIVKEKEARERDLANAQAHVPQNLAAITAYTNDISSLNAHQKAVREIWEAKRDEVQEGIIEAEFAVLIVEEALRELGVTPPP